MMRRICRSLAVAAVCVATIAAAEPVKLEPQESLYELHMGPLTLGDARFSLEPTADNCYRYQYLASPQGIAKMFVGQIHEISDFCMTEANAVEAKHYEFHRSDRAEKDWALDFDWDAKVARGGEPKEQKLTPGALDRLGIQQAVRLWVIAHAADENPPQEVAYAMADRTRVTEYRFALGRREKIKVPAGTFDTIIVQRVDDPKKTLRFWLAPERDYTPVKVVQDQDGQPELRMLLK